MGDRPLIGREGVIVGGGELVLGRLAIVHRQDQGVGEAGHAARAAVVDVKVGDDEAATVEIEHHRLQPFGGVIQVCAI